MHLSLRTGARHHCDVQSLLPSDTLFIWNACKSSRAMSCQLESKRYFDTVTVTVVHTMRARPLESVHAVLQARTF